MVCAWLAALVVMTSSAYANDPLAKPTNVEARDRLSEGNKLYRLREFEKAADAYKAGSLKEGEQERRT